jgi:uncharacterized protein YneF (UPF0154 family)
MTRWSWKDLKDNNIHVNTDGIGKKLVPSSKKPSEEQIKKVLDKLKKKHDKSRL